jgi:hypothetical protein
MAADLRASRHRRLPLAIGLSAAVHLALLAAFILGLRVATAPAPSPPVDLALMAPARRPPPATASPTGAAPVAPAAPRAAATLAPPPTQSAFPPALAAQPSPPAPSLTASLRGPLGCDYAALLRLSAAEQRACQGRLAGPAGEGRRAFATDASTVAAFDAARGPLHDDFLLSMPKTGCKPRVVSEQIASGAAGRQDIHAGITCVIRF